MNDFDKIAPHYDAMARLVFGDSIKKAQLSFIDQIPESSEVLIIGGGTGWIAQEIFQKVKDVRITYLEKSEQMIALSQSSLQEVEKSKLTFVNKSLEDFETSGKYDVIVANFFLDVFSKGQLTMMVRRIKKLLRPSGLLLVSDFQINDSWLSKMWQKPLLWLMHAFFRFMSQLQSTELQGIADEIEKHGFKLKKRKFFFGKVIFSSVYEVGAEIGTQ